MNIRAALAATLAVTLAVTLAGLMLAGCTAEGGAAPDGGADAGNGGSSGVPEDVSGTVAVFAAASLVDVLTEVAADFEGAYPGTTVELNFAGSSTLAAQINQGAPADVFFSASPATMTAVVDAGNASGTPQVVVRNQLVIAVPAGNPLDITTLADLADPDLKVALCDEQVPCGAAAEEALAAGGVELTPVTLERDVRAALSRVVLGEVDAALVYRTDAASSPDVDGVEFAESVRAVNDYPVAVLSGAPNPGAARAFIAYLSGDAARAVFTAAGFQAA